MNIWKRAAVFCELIDLAKWLVSVDEGNRDFFADGATEQRCFQA